MQRIKGLMMNSVVERTRPIRQSAQDLEGERELRSIRGPSLSNYPHPQPFGIGDKAGRWGMAVVLLLLAYEWLLSALDKLLSSSFRGGLGDALRQGMKDNPNRWYAHFLSAAVMPHIGIAAALVEVGEVLVAAGLIAGAGLWLRGAQLPVAWARTLQIGVIGALVGSAVMTANYYLLAGNTWPGLNTGNPFNEGLSVDGLMTLVAVALIAVHVLAIRAGSRKADQTVG